MKTLLSIIVAIALALTALGCASEPLRDSQNSADPAGSSTQAGQASADIPDQKQQPGQLNQQTETKTASQNETTRGRAQGTSTASGKMPTANPPTTPQALPAASPSASPSAAPQADPRIFATEELGLLVKAGEGTRVEPAEKPFWTSQTLATAAFRRPEGKIYTLLVFERKPDEMFEDWLMRSEVGGTTVSNHTARTKNGLTAYVYDRDDYGATPNIHILVPSQRFVYHFKSEEESFIVPDDFIEFVQEIEVQ